MDSSRSLTLGAPEHGSQHSSPHGRRRTPRWTMELFEATRARLRRLRVEEATPGLAYGSLVSLAPLTLVALSLAAVVPRVMSALDDALADGVIGMQAAPLAHEWVEDVRPWAAVLASLGVAAFVMLSSLLFVLLRATLEDVFETWSEKEPTLGESVARRSLALVAWISFTAALCASLSTTMAASGVGLGLLFLSMVIAYGVLPPARLGIGDILQAATVASLAIACVLLALRGIATSVAFGGIFGAAGMAVVAMGLPFAAARAFLFGAVLAAELSRRRAESVHEQAALDALIPR